MSDQDRNPIISVASKFGKGVVKVVKGVGQLAVPFLEVYGEQVCLQCHKPVHPDFEFCSDACCLDYWREFQAHCYKTAGHKFCGYPGCSKPCFVDKHSRRVHDYCSRTHANEHRALQAQSQKVGNSHHGNRCHGNRHHAGNQSGHGFRLFQDKGPIKFYNRDDPYYEFTNFYNASIQMNGKQWPTSEHYFQAQKFVGTPYVEQIRHLSRPREAFDFTRDPRVSFWRRSDWEDVKEGVMYCALLAKFTQHGDLRNLLLGTKERKLIEHSPYDSYWGDGGDGTGKNRLGELLQRVRDELQCGQKGKKASSFPFLNQCETVKEHPQSCSNYATGGQEKEHNDTPPAAADPQSGPLHKDSSHSDSDDNMDCDDHTPLPNQQPPGPHQMQQPPGPHQMPQPPGPHQMPQPPGPRQMQQPPGPHQMPQPPGPHQMQRPPGPHQMQQPPGPHQMPQPPGPHQMPQPPGPHQMPQPPGPHQMPQPPGPHQMPQPPGPHQTPQPPGPHQMPQPPGPHQMHQPPGPHQMHQPPGPHQMPQPPGPHQMPQPPGPHQMQQLVYPPNAAPTYPQFSEQQLPPPQLAYSPNGALVQPQFNQQCPNPQLHGSIDPWQAQAVGEQPKPVFYDTTPLTPTTTNPRGTAAAKDVKS